MVLQASDFNPIKNGNPFAIHTDTRPTPINAIGTASKTIGIIRLYKDRKYRFATELYLLSLLAHSFQIFIDQELVHMLVEEMLFMD